MVTLSITNHLITTYPFLFYEQNPIVAWILSNTGWMGVLLTIFASWLIIFILYSKWKMQSKVLFTILILVFWLDFLNNITLLFNLYV